MTYLNRVGILARKELKDVFTSPLIYVITGLFTALIGWLFFNYLMQNQQLSSTTISNSVIIPIFGNINFLFMFICPLLTMRSFAEEKKHQTIDLLLRSKLSESQIIFGKLIANSVSAFFLLAFTLIFPIILAISGYSDWGVVLSCYFGIMLSIICYSMVGMFASSLTDNQIVASLMSFCFLLGSLLLVVSSNATSNYIVGQILQYFSTGFHFESFTRGLIRSYSLVYFATYVLIFFLMTKKSLEARRW